MEFVKTNKNNFIVKTWKRCRSFPRLRNSGVVVAAGGGVLAKSKSWNGNGKNKKKKMAPEGFFPVYVGPEKQRFAIKTKYASHPLFTVLLEDAETEFGYSSDGPILLPCDVDLFCKVLVEMKMKMKMKVKDGDFGYGSCSPFNPGRRFGTRLGINGADQMVNGYGNGSFEALLTPESLIRLCD